MKVILASFFILGALSAHAAAPGCSVPTQESVRGLTMDQLSEEITRLSREKNQAQITGNTAAADCLNSQELALSVYFGNKARGELQKIDGQNQSCSYLQARYNTIRAELDDYVSTHSDSGATSGTFTNLADRLSAVGVRLKKLNCSL